MTAARSPWPAWCWAAGAAGLVFAARLREIHLHAGDVPFKDQWKVEAAGVIAPWLDGTLRPGAFFAPHFEHVPVWTRLLAWAEVAVTGRWDPLVQATVNSLLCATFVAAVVRWLGGRQPAALALAAGALLGSILGLSHGWENITWGFQSQFPLALLALFFHVRGSFEHAAGSRGWWLAQGAGLAGLFTLAGMWLAPLAVGIVTLWIAPRGPRLRLVPLAIAAGGLAMSAVLHAGGREAATGLAARNAGEFFFALLDQLGWPAGWPGALALLNLPLLLLGLQLRGRGDAPAFDRITLALGAWAAGLAGALSFARGAGYYGYVSRYGELLAVLPLANALALARLVPALRRGRRAGGVFAAAWVAVVVTGAWQLSTGGHARHFHERSAGYARLRRDAVQAYLARGDRRLLEQPDTQAILYPVPGQITSLLDRAQFRALLPHSVWPENPPDFAGTTVRRLQARAGWLVAPAALLLAAGFVLRARTLTPALSPFAFHAEPLLPWLAVPVALVAGVLVFRWPDPLTLDQDERWRHFFQPPGSVGLPNVHLIGGSPQLPDDHFFGAVPLSPPGVRFQFSGTNPGTPEFRGELRSQPFPISSPWFIVPYSGAPVAHGNGLRLQIEEVDGTRVIEVACPGPNREDVGYWAADVRPYVGKRARLVLYDGRTDTEAWVGAAPPIAADSPDRAARMAADFTWEQTAHLHHALARVAGAALVLLALWLAVGRPSRKAA